jgi:hypothetical protein
MQQQERHWNELVAFDQPERRREKGARRKLDNPPI